jgi:hypothetical protein
LRQGDFLKVMRLALDCFFDDHEIKDADGYKMHNFYDVQLEHLEQSLNVLVTELSTLEHMLGSAKI